MKGFPSNEGVKEGYPLKRHYFATIGSSSVKRLQIGTDMLLIIASIGHGLFNFININDLEPPKGGYSEFFAIFAAAHISRVNCDEMPEDRPRQPAYQIFSIKRRL